MADDFEVVERFIADTGDYVRNLERAAREADEFGEQNAEAREAARRMGMAAEEAGERAARAQAHATREAERLAEGTGDVEKAARAAARAQRELEKAEIAQARAARAATAAADREADQYAELAREATRAAAAQRLAELAASGQIDEHNELVRRLREEYGDLGDDGGNAFAEIERAARFGFRGVASSASAGLSGIAPMLLALPFLATLAGNGMILGLGAGLAAIPAITASKSEEVQKEFTQLKDHVVGSLKEWSEPWEDTLVGLADDAGEAFDDVGSTLRQVFSDLAPIVERFGGHALDALTELEPAIEAISDAFGRVLNDLGPRLPGILANVGDGVQAIADAVAENPEELGQFLEDMGALAELAGHLTALLIKLYPTINSLSGAWDSVGGAVGWLMPLLEELAEWFLAVSNPISLGVKAWEGLSKAITLFGVASGDAKNETLDLSGVMDLAQSSWMAASASAHQMNTEQSASAQLMQLATKSAQDLKMALDQLAGKELSAREAAIQYGAAVDNLSKQIKENGAAHGFNTAKGRENEAALNQLVTASHQSAVAMRDNGASAKEVGKFMAGARKRVIDAAQAMGYSEKEARQLADKLYGVRNAAKAIPNREHIDVTANTSPARREINQMIWWASRRAVSVMVNAMGFAQGGLVAGFADGGHVKGFPTGGMVRGPGTATSDSIPARLSNGEFVVNARATKEFLPLLKAINRQGRTGSVAVPPAPMPTPVARASAGGTTVIQNVTHVHVAGTVVAERQLLDVVQKQAQKRGIRNPGTDLFGRR